MLIQYVNFLITTIVIVIALFHKMVMVIIIITVPFIEIVIVETTTVAILKQKNACLQTTLEKLIVIFKVNDKYTKNNTNETALLLALNIALILSSNRFLLKNKIETKRKLTQQPLPRVEDNLCIG